MIFSSCYLVTVQSGLMAQTICSLTFAQSHPVQLSTDTMLQIDSLDHYSFLYGNKGIRKSWCFWFSRKVYLSSETSLCGTVMAGLLTKHFCRAYENNDTIFIFILSSNPLHIQSRLNLLQCFFIYNGILY